MPSFIDLPQKEEFTETINQIVELKSRRKYLFQSNINENQLRLDGLGILQERIDALRQVSRDLQSAVSTVNNRIFVSEEPEFLSGEVKPNTPIGEYEVEIVDSGEKQILMSSPLPDDLQLTASRVEIEAADKRIVFNYRGGSAQNFARSLNDYSKGHFSANWVKKSENENFFVLQANEIGPSHRFNLIRDSGDVFTSLNLFKPTPPIIKTLITTDTLLETGWEKTNKNFTGMVIPAGAVWKNPVPGNGSSNTDKLMIPEGTVDFLETRNVFFRIDVVPPAPVLTDTVLTNITNTLNTNQNFSNIAEKEGIPDSLDDNNQGDSPETDSNDLKKIIRELKLNQEPILTLQYKAEDEIRTITLTWGNVNNGRIWLNDIKLGAGIDKTVEFQSIKFINQSPYAYVMGPWFRSFPDPDKDEFLPLNQTMEPQKTQLRFFSVDVEREGNVIDDLIDGVVLRVLKSRPNEPIRFSVKTNPNSYIEQIQDFINQYNFTMDLINLFLAPKKENLGINKVDPEFENMVGIFSKENNIRRIKDRMQRIMQAGYSMEENERPIFLQEYGIKVFISMGNPYHINSSKLELDKKVFESKVEQSGDTIKKLFRFDRDGDLLPDDGFAYRIDKVLSEYLGPRSLLVSLENNLKKEGKNLNRSLTSEEERIESYREKLESDFSKVKQAKQQQKQMEAWLDNINK